MAENDDVRLARLLAGEVLVQAYPPDLWLRAMRVAASLRARLWWSRAKTLGVRVVLLDGDRVLLVRHTYQQGWYLPGGAIDARETPEAAALRELREETGVAGTGRPELHGVYRNPAYSPRDYVVCYVVRDFVVGPHTPDWEIAEIGFFLVRALPDGTTRATRARLAEVLDGAPHATDW